MANLITATILQKQRRTYTEGTTYAFNTLRIKNPYADSTDCVFYYLEKHDRRDAMITYKVDDTYATIIAAAEDAEDNKWISVNVLYKGRSIANLTAHAHTEFWKVDDIVYAWANPSNANQTYVKLETSNFKIMVYLVNHTLAAFMNLANAATAGEYAISTTTGITAYATGGQTNATQLDANYNDITTCATNGDSVKLWAAALGEWAIVKNNGAATCDVFPYTGDRINDLAVNAAYNIPPGHEVRFQAISATYWETNEVYYGRPTKNIDAIQILGTNMTTSSILSAVMAATVSGQGIDIGYSTSDVEAGFDGMRVTDSRNHDDGGADAYRGLTYEASGNWPGTAASTTYLINAEYSGTTGASGVNATVYGIRSDISAATLTAGTTAAGYFSDAATNVTLCNGTAALTIVGGIAVDTIDITPTANVDAIDVIGTNMTTASVLDADLSAHVSGQVIDIALDTSNITADADIIRITDTRDHDDGAGDTYMGVTVENGGNFPGTNASITYLVNAEYSGALGASGALATLYCIRGDLSTATLTAGTYAAGYFCDTPNTVHIADGTNGILATMDTATAMRGVYVVEDATNTNNAAIGVLVSKDITLTTDAAANATLSNYAAQFGVNLANGDDAGYDVLCAANAVEVDYTLANAATAIATADTLTGHAIDVTVTASVADDPASVINSLAASGLTVDYNVTQVGAGTLNVNGFSVIDIDYDSAGAPAFASGDFNFYNVTITDAATPAYAATGYMSAFRADMTAVDVTDAQFNLYGLNLISPTAAATSAISLVNLVGDTVADANNAVNLISVTHDGSATGGAVLHTGMLINYDLNLTSNGANATRQTNPVIDLDILLTETANVCTITSGFLDMTLTGASDADLGDVTLVGLSTAGGANLIIDGADTVEGYKFTAVHTSNNASARTYGIFSDLSGMTMTLPATGGADAFRASIIDGQAGLRLYTTAAGTNSQPLYVALAQFQGGDVVSVMTTASETTTSAMQVYDYDTTSSQVLTLGAGLTGLNLDFSYDGTSGVIQGGQQIYGTYINAATQDEAEAAIIHYGRKGLSGAITADRAINGFAVDLAASGNNTSAGDFDMNWTAATSGVMQLAMSHIANTSVGAKTDADAFNATALYIDVDCTTSEANTSATATARALDINYTTTQTLGTLNLNPTDIARINLDVDAGTAISSAGTGSLNMLLLDADGFIPGATVANATDINALKVDMSAASINDVQASLYGAQFIMPTTDHATATDVSGIMIYADTTEASNAVNGIVISKDLANTAAGAGIAQTNSALNISSINTNTEAQIMTIGNVLTTIEESNTASAAGADIYNGTVLSLSYSAITDTLGTATSSAVGLLIDYNVTETAGTLTLDDFDVVRIDYDSSGTPAVGDGAYNLLKIIGTDANSPVYGTVSLSGVNVDLSAIDDTDTSLTLYGINSVVPTTVGLPYMRAAGLFTDGTNTAYLANGSMAVEAGGINENKYYWCDDFDYCEDAAQLDAHQTDYNVRWTVGGTNHAAANQILRVINNGNIELTTNGAANDSEVITNVNPIRIDSNPIFEVRFETDSVAANTNCVYMGLTETATPLANANFEAVTDDFILVGIDTGESSPANVRLCTDDNGGAAQTGLIEEFGVGISANVYCTIRVDCTDTEQPRVWINTSGGAITPSNEVLAASITGTIQAGISMYPVIFVEGLAAAASELTVDYFKIWQSR